MNKNILSKVWVFGQILVGISLFFIFLRERGLLQFSGLIGSVIWIISQTLFLMNKRRR